MGRRAPSSLRRLRERVRSPSGEIRSAGMADMPENCIS